tara:strand:- start:1081 stop:1827 length:747 start_codon:yes stop_codon:yes gene_type:complete
MNKPQIGDTFNSLVRVAKVPTSEGLSVEPGDDRSDAGSHDEVLQLLGNNSVINLETRPDRWKHLETEFTKLNIIPRRFSALKHENGVIGCTESHICCLKNAIKDGAETIFICEDDISFTNEDVFMNSLKCFVKDLRIEWDVLLIGGNVQEPVIRQADYCYKVYNCQTTIGYVVKKHYYETLLKNFEEGLRNLIEIGDMHNFAIDQYWKTLQRRDSWYILAPLTVTQWSNHSDIEGRFCNYDEYMLNIE